MSLIFQDIPCTFFQFQANFRLFQSSISLFNQQYRVLYLNLNQVSVKNFERMENMVAEYF